MTDIHYRTTRKFTRDTPSTNINPQSIIKQSSLTFYNNTLQKKKTESKRYTNANETQFNNKTIDFSDFKTNRKTLSVTKQNDFNPLPQIKIPINKKGAKKGSFLQIWLNDALDQGSSQPNQSQTTSTNNQTLGALKLYGLDKKMLKSKNISEETIDKIYKKLYIYTKGLGITFEEIGKLASAKYPDTQGVGEGSMITEIFWKAFTKLLQSESPFQTSFQTVEKGHLKTIQELRQKMMSIREENEANNKVQEQQIRKYQRQLQKMINKYKNLQGDFNINKSTLQLTDKTLDQQILLRLKFQQKINTVYCSYEQIKTKYKSLIQEMKIKKEMSSEMEQNEKFLKEQLENMTVACKELEHLLYLQKAKNKDCMTQLVIKSEERNQLEKQILQKQQQKQKESDQISQILQRNKLLYSLLNQTKIQKQRMKNLYQEQKQINIKFTARIDDLTQLNNSLFEQKYKIHNGFQQIKQANQSLTQQVKTKTQQLYKLNEEISSLRQEVKELNNELSHEKSIKTDLSQQLQIKTQLLIKANQTLAKLKQIKDRHQRLQQLAQHDRNIAIQQKLSAMSKMQQQQHQLQSISNQLQQCKQQSDIVTNKLNKTNELIKKKVTQLQEQVTKKDKTLLTHLNTIQIERIAVMKREKQIELMKERLQSKDSSIYNLQASKVYLETNQPIIEQKLHTKEQQLKAQAQLFIENLVKQKCLDSKIQQLQNLVKVKRNQTQVQVEAYKKLSEYYKLMFIERRNFIHPMIYEDILGVLQKLQEQNKRLNRQISSITQMKQQFQQKQFKLNQQNQHLKNNIQVSISKINYLSINNEKLQSQNDKLINSIKDEMNKLEKLLEQEKKLKLQLCTAKQQKQQLNKLLTNNNQLVIELKNYIQTKVESLNSVEKSNQQLLKSKDQLLKSKDQLLRSKEDMKIKYQSTHTQLQQTKSKLSLLKEKLKDSKSTKQPKESITKHQNQILPKQLLSKQVQTQQILLNAKSSQNIKSFQQLNIQTTINNGQMTPLLKQRFSPQSKQIVQQLLNQTDHKQHSVPIQEKLQFQTQKQGKQKIKNTHNLNTNMNANRTISPDLKTDKKKVQKKQFQRALKLTFMRR